MMGGGAETNVLFCAPGVPHAASDARQAPPYWFGSQGSRDSSEGPSPSAAFGHAPLSPYVTASMTLSATSAIATVSPLFDSDPDVQASAPE